VLTHRLRRTLTLPLILAAAVAVVPVMTALDLDGQLDGQRVPGLVTHEDAAARGVDVSRQPTLAELEATVRPEARTASGDAPITAAAPTPAGTPGLSSLSKHVAPSCSGNGRDGNRVQVIYVVEKGKTDRYKKLLRSMRSWVADVDDTFALSAKKTGGNLRVRWVHKNCVPVIAREVLPAGSLHKGFSATIKALKARGYTSKARKYLVFADDTKLCGIGQMYDDSSKTGNYNDGRVPMYARVDSGCWATPKGWHSTAAHELMHTLGGVQEDAPHSTPAGHCRDEKDVMCYDDDGRGKVTVKTMCKGSSVEGLFDCKNDDYFNMVPRAGSYLATHWNPAKSSFLDKVR